MTLRWDVKLGRRLWDQDASQGAIAAACHVSRNAVNDYAVRNWPKRAIDVERAQRYAPTGRKKPAPRLKRGATTLPALGSLSE